MEELVDLFVEKYGDEALELWVEVAGEFGVPYEIRDINGKRKAVPKDPQSALAKEYGSGTLQIPPEYWYEKAVKEWEIRLQEYINQAR